MIIVRTEKRTEDFFKPVRRQTRLTAYKYSSQTCIRTCTNVLSDTNLYGWWNQWCSGFCWACFIMTRYLSLDKYQPEGSGSGLLSGSKYSQDRSESTEWTCYLTAGSPLRCCFQICVWTKRFMSLNFLYLLYQPSEMRLLDRTVFWIQTLCGIYNNVSIGETNSLYTTLYNGDLNNYVFLLCTTTVVRLRISDYIKKKLYSYSHIWARSRPYMLVESH